MPGSKPIIVSTGGLTETTLRNVTTTEIVNITEQREVVSLFVTLPSSGDEDQLRAEIAALYGVPIESVSLESAAARRRLSSVSSRFKITINPVDSSGTSTSESAAALTTSHSAEYLMNQLSVRLGVNVTGIEPPSIENVTITTTTTVVRHELYETEEIISCPKGFWVREPPPCHTHSATASHVSR